MTATAGPEYGGPDSDFDPSRTAAADASGEPGQHSMDTAVRDRVEAARSRRIATPVAPVSGLPSLGVTPEDIGGRSSPRSPWRGLVEWLLVVVIALVVALLVKTFIIQAFRIPSESMVPTLEVGDRVLVNKLSYAAHDVRRGDVIVFKRPDSAPRGPDEPQDLIKRVIALPGEQVVARNGTVFINDRRLVEPYLPSGTRTDNLDQVVTVPPDQVFVMGDNRASSRDSRFIGTIPVDRVIGRAFARIWPLSRLGFL